MTAEDEISSEGVIISEIQLLLAEKRTSLAAMRTGIAVFVLPLSVLSFLIATSRYYDIMNVIHLIIPVLAICGALIVLGSYLIIRSIVRNLHHDRLITMLKQKHGKIANLMD